jgi:pimeloyl-ACP methyl ester carboxylesterase
MRNGLRRSFGVALVVACALLAGNLSTTAKSSSLGSAPISGTTMSLGRDVHLFDYERGSVTIEELSAEHRDGVVVRDITYTGPGGIPVRAYLVEPETGGRHAATLFLHWFEPGNPTSSRLEFLEDAVTLAQHGVVGLLPDLTFPWNADPIGDRSDLDRVVAQTIQARRGLDLLTNRADVDRKRIAVVGHDYGGMYGLLVSALDQSRVMYTVAINVDATFSNWFAQFWLGLGGADTVRYEKLLEPTDPIRFVCCGARGGVLYQYSEPDFFIPDSTRRALVSATAELKTYRLYPGAEHELDDETARHDRISWLLDRLTDR